MMADKEDRISDLHDSILLVILSFLGPNDIFRCLSLSKRWQFLPIDHISAMIDLVDETSRYRVSAAAELNSFMDSVSNMLDMSRKIHLNRFAVDFIFVRHRFASQVNEWVDFVTKKNVENIKLICREDHYLLPQTLYSHSSLTSLFLSRCDFDPPRAAVNWISLKSLSLSRAKLLHGVMDMILSGCPVLEVLSLTDCYGPLGEDYILNISSPCLKTFTFENWLGSETCEISAPYVLNLTIIQQDKRPVNFMLKNASSVVRASFIRFNAEYSYLYRFSELFQSLKSVKKLELGTWCIEVFSDSKWNGLRIPKFTQLRSLTVNAYVEKKSIFGIIAILKSAPNLETLLVKGDNNVVNSYGLYDNTDFIQSRLKRVEITNFIPDHKAGEPMLSLVQFLLKKAKVLEEIVITSKGLSSRVSSTNLKQITDKLHSFPKASPEAIVKFDI